MSIAIVLDEAGRRVAETICNICDVVIRGRAAELYEGTGRMLVTHNWCIASTEKFTPPVQGRHNRLDILPSGPTRSSEGVDAL